MTNSEAPSKTKQNELFALDVNTMTRYHLIYIMFERARNMLQARLIKDENVRTAFMRCFSNFALKQLSLDSVPLYETGFFGPGSNDLLEAAYKQNLTDLRPDMVGLSELNPVDGGLISTIGNYYGDIYEC